MPTRRVLAIRFQGRLMFYRSTQPQGLEWTSDLAKARPVTPVDQGVIKRQAADFGHTAFTLP